MEVAALVVAAFAILIAGAAGGIAYGYRGQCAGLRDQVEYLRASLALARNEPPPTQTARLPVPMRGGLNT